MEGPEREKMPHSPNGRIQISKVHLVARKRSFGAWYQDMGLYLEWLVGWLIHRLIGLLAGWMIGLLGIFWQFACKEVKMQVDYFQPKVIMVVLVAEVFVAEVLTADGVLDTSTGEVEVSKGGASDSILVSLNGVVSLLTESESCSTSSQDLSRGDPDPYPVCLSVEKDMSSWAASIKLHILFSQADVACLTDRGAEERVFAIDPILLQIS